MPYGHPMRKMSRPKPIKFVENATAKRRKGFHKKAEATYADRAKLLAMAVYIQDTLGIQDTELVTKNLTVELEGLTQEDRDRLPRLNRQERRRARTIAEQKVRVQEVLVENKQSS